MWAQKIPGCLSTSMWGPVVAVLEEGGPPREYGKQWPLMALLLCQSEPFVIGLAFTLDVCKGAGYVRNHVLEQDL